MTDFTPNNKTISTARAFLNALKENSPESDAEGWVEKTFPGVQEIASQELEPEGGLPDGFGPKVIEGGSDY